MVLIRRLLDAGRSTRLRTACRHALQPHNFVLIGSVVRRNGHWAQFLAVVVRVWIEARICVVFWSLTHVDYGVGEGTAEGRRVQICAVYCWQRPACDHLRRTGPFGRNSTNQYAIFERTSSGPVEYLCQTGSACLQRCPDRDRTVSNWLPGREWVHGFRWTVLGIAAMCLTYQLFLPPIVGL